MNSKLIFSLLLLFSSAADAQPKKADQARSSKRYMRNPSRTKMAGIEPEMAQRANTACDNLQREYNNLLSELNKVRTSKAFRDNNQAAKDKAIQLESRINQMLPQLVNLASGGNDQAAAAA